MLKIFSLHVGGRQAAPKHTPALLNRSPGGPWAAAPKPRPPPGQVRGETL